MKYDLKDIINKVGVEELREYKKSEKNINILKEMEIDNEDKG